MAAAPERMKHDPRAVQLIREDPIVVSHRDMNGITLARSAGASSETCFAAPLGPRSGMRMNIVVMRGPLLLLDFADWCSMG